MRLIVLITAIVLALFSRAFLISVYKVSTQSMAPALAIGDFILASKTSYGFRIPWTGEIYFESSPKIGDLIVYQKNSKIFVKRVLATPNSQVELKSGQYFINSEPCTYEFLEKIESTLYGRFSEKCGLVTTTIIKLNGETQSHDATVKKLSVNQYFVVGDYRNFDGDPETADIIGSDQIVGKPLFIWLSYSATQDFTTKDVGIRWNRIMTML